MLRLLLFILNKTKKGVNFMSNLAIVYATLIIEGLRTYASVPTIIKPQVASALTALGFPELITE